MEWFNSIYRIIPKNTFSKDARVNRSTHVTSVSTGNMSINGVSNRPNRPNAWIYASDKGRVSMDFRRIKFEVVIKAFFGIIIEFFHRADLFFSIFRVQRVLLLVEINSSGKFIVYNAITNSQTKLIRFDFTSEKCFERTLFQIT